MRGVTEDYEQRLWDELNLLLAEAVPDGSSEEDAQRAILLAVTGHDVEITDLYERVKRLARTEGCYLRERMEEDNPVSAVQRQIRDRGKQA